MGGLTMAKAVVISIRPEWVSRILGGEKTLEVRKSRPKLETPFKCYIYCAKGRKPWVLDGFPGIRQDGNVAAEFTCDKIDIIRRMGIPANFDYCYLPLNEWGNDDIETEIRDIRGSCIPKEMLNAYAGKSPMLYAWHISDLRIYGKPHELGEFERPYKCNECDAKWASELTPAMSRTKSNARPRIGAMWRNCNE